MKKLSFFSLLLICLNFFACSDLMDSGGDTVLGCMDENSFNYDSTATIDNGSCIGMEGCLGYQPNLGNSGYLISSFGNAQYDQKFWEEVALQREFFQGVPADVKLLMEPSAVQKNAYASTNGQIRFGYFLFWDLLYRFGELPIAGVLAHEWGHRTQFTSNWNDYAQPAHKELEADAFAGFYMFLAKQWAWSRVDNYYNSVFASGDYNFNDPLHHGTPQERLDAAYLGVQIAAAAIDLNYQFSYAELHEIFNEHIQTVIKPRSNSNTEPIVYTEIEFPKNVTKEQARALFPRK